MGVSKNIINTLPQGIIESILSLLPIEEAARTSILSREWRYKWTKIPKVKFSQFMIENNAKQPSNLKKMSAATSGRDNMEETCKVFYIIHQVMLLRQGPIQEFTLDMYADETCYEIDQIIRHLSTNHSVKKIKLLLNDAMSSYVLPSSIYSFHHLMDLRLQDCEFNSKLVPQGFTSLTTLKMSGVSISRENLLHLLLNCPSLRCLCLTSLREWSIGSDDYNFLGYGRPNIMLFFKFLPVIEDLTIYADIIKFFLPSSIPKEHSASMIHLKCCSIELVGFENVDEMRFLGLLVKCSPNLEKINLKMAGWDVKWDSLQEYSDILEEYTDVWWERLNELEIERVIYYNSPELEFVKFIMARSPNLKKVTLLTDMDDKEKLQMKKKLSRAPRVSASAVEIIVECWSCKTSHVCGLYGCHY